MSTSSSYISSYKRIGQQLLDHHGIDMLRLASYDFDNTLLAKITSLQGVI